MMSHLEKKKNREKSISREKIREKKSNLLNRKYPQTVVLPILTVVKRKKTVYNWSVCVCLWMVHQKKPKSAKNRQIGVFCHFWLFVNMFLRIFGIEGQFLYKTNNNKKKIQKFHKKNSLDNLTKKNKNNVVRDCKFLTKFCSSNYHYL